MKILIIGGTGMLGHQLCRVFSRSFDTFATLRGDYSEYSSFEIFDKDKTFGNIDVENIESVRTVVEQVKPDVIINAVGVIKQIPNSKDVVQTLQINSIFPHLLAKIAKDLNARLINISTDCVFEGKNGNYKEKDIPNATDLYGRSKQLGEITEGNVLTIRTSFIGRELKTKNSLVEWFLSNKGKTVKGYSNAIFSGFPTIVFAGILENILQNHPDLKGLYHISSDPIDKFELLTLIKNEYDVNIEIVNFADFKIDRSLDSSKFREITGLQPQSWDKMVKIMANDNDFYEVSKRLEANKLSAK